MLLVHLTCSTHFLDVYPSASLQFGLFCRTIAAFKGHRVSCAHVNVSLWWYSRPQTLRKLQVHKLWHFQERQRPWKFIFLCIASSDIHTSNGLILFLWHYTFALPTLYYLVASLLDCLPQWLPDAVAYGSALVLNLGVGIISRRSSDSCVGRNILDWWLVFTLHCLYQWDNLFWNGFYDVFVREKKNPIFFIAALSGCSELTLPVQGLHENQPDFSFRI